MPMTKHHSSARPLHSNGVYPSCQILVVSPFAGDHQFLAEVLAILHAGTARAYNLQEAGERLKLQSIAVVVTEKDLPDGNWKDIQGLLDLLRPVPLLIVASIAADDHLWAEVLNTGGFDVLAKPFRHDETIHSISHALLRIGTIRDDPPKQRSLG